MSEETPTQPTPSQPEPAPAVSATPSPEGPPDYERFFLVGIIDGILGMARQALSTGMVLCSCKWLAFVGMWALVGFAGLLVIIGLVMAIHAKAFGPLGIGIGLAVLAIALLYTAGKMCNAGHKIIEATDSQLSSQAFLDSLALLAALLGIGALIGGVVEGVQEGLMTPVAYGVGTAVALAFLAAIALNPSLVTTTIQTTATAGQEFISIVSFFIKAALRLVPIVFGAAVTIGTALLLIDFIRYLASEGYQRDEIAGAMRATICFVLWMAALPLIVYLVSLAYYLLLDLARAILRIPHAMTR